MPCNRFQSLIHSSIAGHALRRWSNLISREEENEVTSCYRPPLDLNTTTISRTWGVLPQELIDYIMAMLGNDWQSLKACSLTCKVMLVSARPIIHRKIYLTWENNWESLTVPERKRYLRGERQKFAVRVLSTFAAHGLVPYARHLFIHINKNFTPANLQPFNCHFQRFDRVQELNVYWLDTPGFLKNFNTYFANFVPTLRSLHLDTPTGVTRDILDFVCRFPHLDDLALKMSTSATPGDWRSDGLPLINCMPPFRGRLKLSGITEWRGYLLHQLISLPGKRRFRSIDFRSCESGAEQPIIDACRGTLESISTTWKWYGKC